ncbi:MAG: hypothetical protein OEX04_01745 [Acidimicrobiia bacterium]|nr:hypothetical protein [Acidimicrobiia bacterium]MDH4306178.1 hypothetical protein [Acidimicrobiia bacterium]MDH5292981.1 hypothetical protein [Acidimicrobiia bacterium]
MKRKGLSWDGGKRRVIAAAVLAAMMILPGVAQARSGSLSADQGTSDSSLTQSYTTGRAVRGVSWS